MENVILREYFDASQIDDRLSWFKLTAQSFCIHPSWREIPRLECPY